MLVMRRAAAALLLGALLTLKLSSPVLAEDREEEARKPAGTVPNIYLDLRTTYATQPANALAIGLAGSSFLTTIQNLPTFPPGTAHPALASPASQSVTVDVPLTVDVTDRISVYGGISAGTSQAGPSGWSTLVVNSWNVGFQADLVKQNGGMIPTITLQTTVTTAVPNAPLPATSFNTLLEFDYALNEDETRGLLAGIQYTRINVDSALAKVNPNTIGYVGGYYQWSNNWKLIGRVGVQAFEGARLLNVISLPAFTQPVARIDLDRMDDNDNRLFGLTAQFAWTPKLACQLTLRTPLYAIRN
ncbi:hypothetical protein [Bradyrhizobium sp. 2TAF24]|uniref:hypothetical protein n=1 Tax=Bradyrhizobium sp. 2TAF24 TaxID=3233011 RepID=UPI003F9351B5